MLFLSVAQLKAELEAEVLEKTEKTELDYLDDPAESDDQLVSQYQQQLAQYNPRQRAEHLSTTIPISTLAEPAVTSQTTVQDQLDAISSDDMNT